MIVKEKQPLLPEQAAHAQQQQQQQQQQCARCLAPYVADVAGEIFGTFLLTFIICCVVASAVLTESQNGIWQVCFVAGAGWG